MTVAQLARAGMLPHSRVGRSIVAAVTRAGYRQELGDSARALAEFGQAIELNPARPDPYAARGFATYPSGESIQDLETAVELGLLSFWAGYYLAYHYASLGDWVRAERLAESALRLQPPPDIAADLTEWLAIATVELGRDPQIALRLLHQARELAPSLAGFEANLRRIQTIQRDGKLGQVAWSVERNRTATREDLLMACG